MGQIVWWFAILLGFDFTWFSKKKSTHKQADHVSKITNGKALVGKTDKLPDPMLFQIKMVPKWSERVVFFLNTTKVQNLGRLVYE